MLRYERVKGREDARDRGVREREEIREYKTKGSRIDYIVLRTISYHTALAVQVAAKVVVKLYRNF